VGALRVVIAEDNLLMREGVRRVLEEAGVAVVGVCGSLEELLLAADEQRPDVVLTDIRMPPTGRDEGIVAARRLQRSHPTMGVLVLSQYIEPAYALALLDEGSRGRGYVLKDHIDDGSRLVSALEAVATGGSYVDSDVVDALVRGRRVAVESPLSTLTRREQEILAEVASGRNNAAIADTLGVSANAVEKHINSIFAKLGLSEDGTSHRRVKAVLAYLANRPG
jgi:DNA-binding NarL/FixJ family response regulator